MRLLLTRSARRRSSGGVASASPWLCSCSSLPLSFPSSSRSFSSPTSSSASPLSGLRRVLVNASTNRPLIGWVLLGSVVLAGVTLYNTYSRESLDEAQLLEAAFDAVLCSSVAAALHPAEVAAKGAAVRLLKGQRLNGYVEGGKADVWYEVRLMGGGAGEAGEKQTKVLGVYKLRVTAHRDRPQQPQPPAVTAITIEGTNKDAATATAQPPQERKEAEPGAPLTIIAALPTPPWQVDGWALTSPSRQLSYTWEKGSDAAFHRSSAFIPVNTLPRHPPAPSTAPTAVASPSSSSSSPPPPTSSSPPSSSSFFSFSPSFEWTWPRVLLFCGAGLLVSAVSVSVVRRQRRTAAVRRLSEAVERALQRLSSSGRGVRALGERPRVVRVVDSDVGSALLRATFEVRGTRGDGLAAASARVNLQAVKQGDAHSSPSGQWRVVHSVLTTSEGQQVQLQVT